MRFLFFFFIFLSPYILSSQVIEPRAHLDLEANAQVIFIHSQTGIPILQSLTTYKAIHPKEGTVLWSMDRSQASTATSVIGGKDSEVRDYAELVGTPFILVSGKLINVNTGDVIIDGAERGLAFLRSDYTLPDLDLMLLEIAGKGAIYLYAFDPFKGKEVWNVELREMSAVTQMVSESSTNELKPYLNSAGSLLYPNGKYLAAIDPASGKLLWNNKLDAGYIFTNEAGTRMVVAEARGMLGMASMAEMSGAAARKYGKRIHLLDAATGESVWKKEKKLDGNVIYITPYDGGFLVVHDEGFNIYSFDAPKSDGRWKKDYSAKVSSVEFVDEGLMVYFKNKRMLVDPKTGDDVWKKPEKLEKERSGFLWASGADEPNMVGKHEVFISGNSVRVANALGFTFSYEYILVQEDKIAIASYIPNEDSRTALPTYRFRVIDLSGDKPTTTVRRVAIKRGLQAFDAIDGGYFFYNSQAFHILKYDPSEGLSTVTEKFYKDPAALGRFLTDLAVAAGTTTMAVNSTANQLSSNAGSAAAYNAKMDALSTASDIGYGANDGGPIGRVDQQFAFFFGRDKKDGLTLFKVDKNTGEEVNKFRFDDQTPLYEIDYINNKLYYQADREFRIYDLE